MYYLDHNPPHFHVDYQGFRAKYKIKELGIISGKLPPRAHALVLEWASIHRNELMANWKKASVPEPLKPIKPLN